MSPRAFARRLRVDARGTSFVEMGMLAPFFAVMVLGTVDASRAVTEKLKLQQAATRAIEMASAGGPDSDAFDNLQAEAAAAAGVSTNQATVDTWLECDRVRQPEFDGECTSTQEIGRYASVAVRNTYAPWFASSLAGMGYNISRTITIEGKASVRMQ